MPTFYMMIPELQTVLVYQDACAAMRYVQLNACNGTGDNLNVRVYNRDNINNEETELDTQNCSKAK